MKPELNENDRFTLKLIFMFIVLFISAIGILAYIEINKQNNCFELLSKVDVDSKNQVFIEKVCR